MMQAAAAAVAHLRHRALQPLTAFSTPPSTPKMPPGNTASHDEPNTNGESSAHTFSLENILGGDHENIEHPTASKEALTPSGGWDEEAGQESVAQGFCVECEGA